jgi:hypothetical protein
MKGTKLAGACGRTYWLFLTEGRGKDRLEKNSELIIQSAFFMIREQNGTEAGCEGVCK